MGTFTRKLSTLAYSSITSTISNIQFESFVLEHIEKLIPYAELISYQKKNINFPG